MFKQADLKIVNLKAAEGCEATLLEVAGLHGELHLEYGAVAATLDWNDQVEAGLLDGV